MLNPNTTILFQGDSITDAGRTYESDPTALLKNKPTPCELGVGYPDMIKAHLDTFCSDKNIKVLNRAISGNRVEDLQARWEEDCIALKPDYLSILVGINDTWRRYDGNDITTAQSYEQTYHDILTRAKAACNCELIILEPFLIPSDPQKLRFYDDLVWKIQVARKLAREFKATYIPLDGIFAKSCVSTQPSVLSLDGVHPTDVGHQIIAKSWLEAML